MTHVFSFFLFLRFGWVIAAIASTAWLGVWQSRGVGMARREAKIPYPQGERFFSTPGVRSLELT